MQKAIGAVSPRHLLLPLAVFLCIAAPTAAAMMAAPYTGKAPPHYYAPPKPVAKFQDRVPTAPIIPRVVSVETIKPAAVSPTHEQITLRWSCETIRERAKGVPIDQVKKRARAFGLSEKEIEEVLACLKEKKTSSDPCGPARYETNRAAYLASRPQPC